MVNESVEKSDVTVLTETTPSMSNTAVIPEWACAVCGREADPLYRVDGRDICGDCRKALQRKSA